MGWVGTRGADIDVANEFAGRNENNINILLLLMKVVDEILASLLNLTLTQFNCLSTANEL